MANLRFGQGSKVSEEKYSEVIRRFMAGEKITSIRRSVGLRNQTVSDIIKARRSLSNLTRGRPILENIATTDRPGKPGYNYQARAHITVVRGESRTPDRLYAEFTDPRLLTAAQVRAETFNIIAKARSPLMWAKDERDFLDFNVATYYFVMNRIVITRMLRRG